MCFNVLISLPIGIQFRSGPFYRFIFLTKLFIKVIKKKLVRKTLDMIKKIEEDKYADFWKEYSTNIKLGVIEDTANRTRLAKLLR